MRIIQITRGAKLLSAIFALSLFLVSGGAIWAYFALKNIDRPLILHFNDMVGIMQIGGVVRLIAVGVTGIIAVIVNFNLAMQLKPRNDFLARILAAWTLLISFLIFISFAAIISVN